MLKVLFNKITTSRRQGQSREGLSGGSPSAKLRVHGQKRHIRLRFRGELAQDNETRGIENQGKWRDCATKVCVLIRGGLSHPLNISVNENVQKGNWKIKPRSGNLLSIAGSEPDSTPLQGISACTGNRMGDGSEVSIGHSSQSVGVMAGAGRRTEHFPKRSPFNFRIEINAGNGRRNRL